MGQNKALLLNNLSFQTITIEQNFIIWIVLEI